MVLFTIGVWVHPKVLMVRGSVSLKLPRSRFLGSLPLHLSEMATTRPSGKYLSGSREH
jgi:hypothetical protein